METGIFIGHKQYRNSHIPALCSLIFAEIGISIWQLKPIATILRSNESGLKYNKMLGFKILEDDPEKEYVKLILDSNNLGLIARKLRAGLGLLLGDDPITITFEKEDFDSGLHALVYTENAKKRIKRVEKVGESVTYYL